MAKTPQNTGGALSNNPPAPFWIRKRFAIKYVIPLPFPSFCLCICLSSCLPVVCAALEIASADAAVVFAS